MATAPGGVEIEWDSQAQEHIFINEEKGVRSSYPTVAFLLKRMQLAQSMEAVAGVALWELGQMMGMFIDLF
jgi:hypothetical protein